MITITIGSMAERKERLVLSILEFLEASIADGTVSADDREGVEVAGKKSSQLHKRLILTIIVT